MTTRRVFLGDAGRLTVAAIAGPALGVFEAVNRTAANRLVHTVTGPINAQQLGFTLPHEHIAARSAGLFDAWPELFGPRARFIDRVAARLKALRAAGVATIVEVTPSDLGRDVRLLREVSRKSGVRIVACTGHWLTPSPSMAARSVEELTDFFVLEHGRGLDGTGIKPGVIKIASDREVTPFLDKALRAAARAGKQTGLPVTTHSHAASRGGERQAELFESEGLDPEQVCIGHSDESNDLGYLTGLARRGYMIGMDHFPVGARSAAGLLSWQTRADTVARLLEAGHVDRLLLSNDWFFELSIAPTGSLEALERTNPEGMLFLMRTVLPYLAERGVTPAQIRTMTVENPRRFFGR